MTNENLTHKAKMRKIKLARDKMMETKSSEKGLIIIHTGKGKGKSSSAFGMIFRCIAHQMPCGVIQFIKGAWSTGERTLIEEKFSDLCEHAQRISPWMLNLVQQSLIHQVYCRWRNFVLFL